MTDLDHIRDEVLQRADIAVHAERTGFRPAPGRRNAYFCAFHENHRTPAASVKGARMTCFSVCGRSWDVIDLTMARCHLDYVSALRELAAELCIPFPDRQPLTPDQRRRHARAKELAPALGRAAYFWWKGRRCELEDFKRNAIDGDRIDVAALASAAGELHKLESLGPEAIVRSYLTAAKDDPEGTAGIVAAAEAWDAASTEMVSAVVEKIAAAQEGTRNHGGN